MGVKQAIKSLDAFPRAEDHLLQKTQSGAVVSIIGLVIMAILFLHELRYYLTTYTFHQMAVNLKRGETLPIHINMTFPSLPCDVLSVDAIDMSGKHEVDLDINMWKLRLNGEGHIIGTEYLSDLVEKEHTAHKHDGDHQEDSENKIHLHGFNQDTETVIKKLKQALANGEGCRVYGVLDVQRVAGNFHISVHGLNIFVAQMIVPTEYRYLSKEVLPTNQFSVTEYYSTANDRTWPAVYFLYDLSPITVTIREERRSFLHFITRLCAGLGGTFALTGLSNSFYHSSCNLKKKDEK
ncbi:endoplasmic reticulum vesicle transporter protein [Actinidia rufa]|uniref:Endoplasmic reticulum vesicle transporter protein n=1 Tax=Actinidia rufa TaxID=165716 RepID=A0A7J0GXH0_9ERIC|nr:endoplasmic reticulum vesicle transporter protein [Actinidia rufa]